jgi:hypothetical protein
MLKAVLPHEDQVSLCPSPVAQNQTTTNNRTHEEKEHD